MEDVHRRADRSPSRRACGPQLVPAFVCLREPQNISANAYAQSNRGHRELNSLWAGGSRTRTRDPHTARVKRVVLARIRASITC